MKEKDEAGAKKGDGRETSFSVVDRRPVFRDDVATTDEPRYPSVVEEFKARAEEAERRAREISAAYRRIDEERDALRERLNRDLGRRVDLARIEMMRKILGVLDDFDRAIAAGRTASDLGPLLSGMVLTREHLMRVLQSEGVQALELLGLPFDPGVAEAVSTEETTDPERDNQVLEEDGKGYMLGGTLLRPARVRVARYRPRPTSDSPDSPSETSTLAPEAPRE